MLCFVYNVGGEVSKDSYDEQREEKTGNTQNTVDDESDFLDVITILLHGSKDLIDVVDTAALIVAAIVQLRVHPAVDVEARLRTDERAQICHALVAEVVAHDAVRPRLAVGVGVFLHEDDALHLPFLTRLLTYTRLFITHFY